VLLSLDIFPVNAILLFILIDEFSVVCSLVIGFRSLGRHMWEV